VRILILADASSPHTRRWCEGLAGLGHGITLASFQQLREDCGGLRDFVRLTGKGRLRYRNAGGQVSALARSADLVFAHFLPAYGVAARAAGTRFVLCLWGSDILLWPFRDALRARTTRWVLSGATRVVADCRAVKQVSQTSFGYPPEAVEVFPFGPDQDVFGIRPGKKQKGLIISPRALEPVYGIRSIMDSLGYLADRGIDYHLLMSFGGSRETEYLTYARFKGVRFSYRGFMQRAQYLESVAHSEIYLSAALSDATPVSLLEAMALGSFPVVSDLPALREWVLDGVNGLVFRPNDPGQMASALRRALEDSEIRERARGLNREMIDRRARWDENLGRFSHLLENLGNEAPPMLARARPGKFHSYLR